MNRKMLIGSSLCHVYYKIRNADDGTYVPPIWALCLYNGNMINFFSVTTKCVQRKHVC